jgi:hypothetical protein
MKHVAVSVAGTTVLVGAVVLCPEVAHAATCDSYSTGPNTVYISGSTAVQPLLQALANELALLPTPIYIIYQKPANASCGGVQDITSGSPDTASGNYLDPTATPAKLTTCTNSGITVDIGVSDVYASSCPGGYTLGQNQYDFLGTISPFEFAVPYTSSQNVINWNAAYAVFGYGGLQYQVAPWTVLGDIFVRNEYSGTEIILASAIGLTPNKWLSGAPPEAGAAQQYTSATALLGALQNAGPIAPNSSIGILAAAQVDPNKKPATVLADGGVSTGSNAGGIKPLAFQAKNQDCGYYADSALNALDKINVRQGRYAPWGATHWITNTTPGDGGTPIPVGNNNNSAAVAQVIAFITHDPSLTTAQEEAEITLEAANSFIPWCAMQVSRSGEVTVDASGESSYQPPKGCGCFFEKQANATQSAYCQPCSTSSPCAAPYSACNHGYCEVQ